MVFFLKFAKKSSKLFGELKNNFLPLLSKNEKKQ